MILTKSSLLTVPILWWLVIYCVPTLQNIWE